MKQKVFVAGSSVTSTLIIDTSYHKFHLQKNEKLAIVFKSTGILATFYDTSSSTPAAMIFAKQNRENS